VSTVTGTVDTRPIVSIFVVIFDFKKKKLLNLYDLIRYMLQLGPIKFKK
jgi:hypothetical protein